MSTSGIKNLGQTLIEFVVLLSIVTIGLSSLVLLGEKIQKAFQNEVDKPWVIRK